MQKGDTRLGVFLRGRLFKLRLTHDLNNADILPFQGISVRMEWEPHRSDVIASAAFKRLGQKELRGQSTAHAQMAAAKHAPSSLTYIDDMKSPII